MKTPSSLICTRLIEIEDEYSKRELHKITKRDIELEKL